MEPQDPIQIDEDDDAVEANVGLIGVPLEDHDLTDEESSSSSDEDFGIWDDYRALEMITFSLLTFCHFVDCTHFDMATIHYFILLFHATRLIVIMSIFMI